MSAVPAIQLHIETLAAEALAAEPVKVVFGYSDAKQLVAIFDTEFDRKFRYLGGNPSSQEEDFKVNLIFEVLSQSGKDMKPAVARCWEIFDLVEAAVRGDHTLEGLSWNALLTTGRQEFFQTDKSQGCRIRSTLAGTARI
jgi:hypothetical protein